MDDIPSATPCPHPVLSPTSELGPVSARRGAHNMAPMELGRLEHIQPRTVWVNEAHDFTPWLLANSDRLGEALGVDLELHVAEHPVGGFSLDLLGRDLTNDAVVIVENQLEGTDHRHLGQILTYAAGTGASTIVWIATAFREEHRQAIDWLNEKTAEDVNFFGVQVSVVQIGSSLPAPLFDVVAKPNEWQKQVRLSARGGSASGRGDQYRRFWTRYLERVRSRHPDWFKRATPQAANWMSFPGPYSGSGLNSSFAAGSRLRHELYIDTRDADANLELFESLRGRRMEVEAAYGRSLEFDEMPGKQACRVAEYREGDVADEHRWDEFIEWFLDCGVRLRQALPPSPTPSPQGAAMRTPQ